MNRFKKFLQKREHYKPTFNMMDLMAEDDLKKGDKVKVLYKGRHYTGTVNVSPSKNYVSVEVGNIVIIVEKNRVVKTWD